MKRQQLLALALALTLLVPAALGAESLAELKSAAAAAGAAAAAAPNDYGLAWKAAKAFRNYGDRAVKDEAQGWKEIAKGAGKEGMKYGEAATKLSPNGIEGWYYYGLSVGVYSDGVSILTALGEGLKGKTQKGFEMAYSTDKMYDNGGPIIALGRFWQVLPGIAGRDLKKAEQLFNEYISLFGSKAEANDDAWYYRGLLYRDGGKKAEARADLGKAAAMGNKDAAKALAELK